MKLLRFLLLLLPHISTLLTASVEDPQLMNKAPVVKEDLPNSRRIGAFPVFGSGLFDCFRLKTKIL